MKDIAEHGVTCGRGQRQPVMERLLSGLLLMTAFSVIGCQAADSQFDRDRVSEELRSRTGFGVRPGEGQGPLPASVDTSDGITEDEAVAIALWSNPAFNEAIAQLGLRRADLAVAGLVQNPMLSMFFPLGPKQLEFALLFPVEALLLRPSRVAAAELDCERVARELVQGGMDVIRDVRSGFVQLWLARRAESLARKVADNRRRVEAVLAARVDAGETAPLDLDRAELARAEADRAVARASAEVSLATIHLRALMGVDPGDDAMTFAGAEPRLEVVRLLQHEDVWTSEVAAAARPDIRAAELAVEQARIQAGVAGWQWLRVSPLLDANARGRDGFEAGPGLTADLPVFDRGGEREQQAQARVAIAAAALHTLRQRVALEVARARVSFDIAVADLRALRERVLPAAVAAQEHARLAVELGDAGPLTELDTESRVLEARQQEARALADVRLARAELARCCGHPPTLGKK